MTVERIPCESCGEREATVHFTEIVGNEKRETHLCEECHHRKALPIQATVTLSQLLGSLLSQVQEADPGEYGALACQACGLTYADFRNTGRFGCPRDYEAFRKPLMGILDRIQDDVRHVGKVPPSAGEALARHNELLKLRRELERAVLREDYEKAKELRDRVARFSKAPHEEGQNN